MSKLRIRPLYRSILVYLFKHSKSCILQSLKIQYKKYVRLKKMQYLAFSLQRKGKNIFRHIQNPLL